MRRLKRVTLLTAPPGVSKEFYHGAFDMVAKSKILTIRCEPESEEVRRELVDFKFGKYRACE